MYDNYKQVLLIFLKVYNLPKKLQLFYWSRGFSPSYHYRQFLRRNFVLISLSECIEFLSGDFFWWTHFFHPQILFKTFVLQQKKFLCENRNQLFCSSTIVSHELR
eukprot:TRINITY_DN4900_c0_g1_i8.p2 TRINITY_DN4900_c0_g1~~TRINITY_DN4900_c0_g1_i8.p2  ORF type:complete len:105 (+),score=2.11 TRINITY_DN4900_c0_g1_i8:2-316(+)